MKNVLIYILFGLAFCPNVSAAKEKILTSDNISCNSSNTYCTSQNGRQLTGKVSRYNGEEKALSNYQNGYLSGLTTIWNADGQIIRKTYYKNGEKNGVEKLFYDNYTAYSSAEYKDGKLHGRVDYYTEKGKLKGRLSYKNGYFEKGYCVVNGQKQDLKAVRTTELLSCGD